MDCKYFSVEEVAALTNMKEDTIRRWIRNGKLKAAKLGRNYRINEEEVKRILEEGV